MNILLAVEFYEPHKGGAEEVVKQLAERLARKGHAVTVATSSMASRTFVTLNGVRVEGFAISGNAVKGIRGSENEMRRYKDFLRGDFDIVLNYATQNWATDLALELVGTTKAKWVLVPCGYSGLKNPAYEKYFESLPTYLQKYNALVYMSENYQDIQFGAEHGAGGKAVIVPNGAAEEEFLPPDTFRIRERLDIKTRYVLVCVANHYLAKGHRFVIDAFRRAKRKDATLLIIGEAFVSSGIRKPAQFVLDYLRCWAASIISPRVRLVSGKDRALVLSAYKSADLFVFGSRTEVAPIVFYESFAAKVPVITTDIGNARDHKDILKIVSTSAEMASIINFLLDNEHERKDMAERAFLVWKKHHTWQRIVERYEELFASLVAS